MARLHKVVEDYAIRLLTPPNFVPQQGEEFPKEATGIARKLSSAYADHGFVIDFAEAQRISLPVEPNPSVLAGSFDVLNKHAGMQQAIGIINISEAQNGKANAKQGPRPRRTRNRDIQTVNKRDMDRTSGSES
ncbi:MAG: hypothetical protein HZA46_07755 [Planctomycetales bacterium]|nr:hypothetical protein [Planctomycetales bacterium]